MLKYVGFFVILNNKGECGHEQSCFSNHCMVDCVFCDGEAVSDCYENVEKMKKGLSEIS